MNGYVEAGYVVILGTLGGYSVSLVARERAARRRVGGKPAADRVAGRDAPATPAITPRPVDEPELSGSP
jgi:hypothetical protein